MIFAECEDVNQSIAFVTLQNDLWLFAQDGFWHDVCPTKHVVVVIEEYSVARNAKVIKNSKFVLCSALCPLQKDTQRCANDEGDKNQ